MARFCGHCGAKAEDNAKICGYCGTPLSTGAGVQTPGVGAQTPRVGVQIPNTNVTLSISNEQKKIIKLAAIGVAALVALIIVINIISGFVGVKGAARKIMDAYCDYDIDALIDMTSDYSCQAVDYFSDSIEDYYEDELSERFEFYENAVGRDYKLKYKITDSYELPDYRADDLYDAMAELAELDDFDISTISKLMIVEVELTIKGKSIEREQIFKLIIAKENGTWKFIGLDG